MVNKPATPNKLAALYDMRCSDLEDSAAVHQPFFSQLKPEPNRYVIKGELPKGGMKTIYDALDPKTGRHVALAKLYPDSPEELYEPFLREARLTALLDHPNCISIYDVGLDEDSTPYFTMELKTGQSLGEILQSDRTDRSELLEVFLKICDAVAYAHSRNVLHLDLKPDNIQVGHYGEVVVCDWGLGKILGGNDYDSNEFDELLLNHDLLNNMTLSGEIKGTPGFMAPEQIERNGEKTATTDIYALGALLYVILTGDHPFTDESDVDSILERTLEGRIAPPQTANSSFIVPDSLSAICMKALSFAPEDRYQSVELLRDDIHSYLTGYVTSAEHGGLARELRLFIARNRMICTLTGVFTLIMLTATILFISNLNQSRIKAETAQKTAVAEREKSDEMRHRAEESLRMYERELKRTQQHSAELLKNAFSLRFHFFFDNPKKTVYETNRFLDRAIKLNPDNKKLIAIRAQQSFIGQKFEKANRIFKGADIGSEDVHRLSLKYVDIPKQHDGVLPISDFAELIDELTQGNHTRRRICERMVALDLLKRKSHTGYGVVIEALVRGWNRPTDEEFLFNYDASSKALSINGKGLKRLQSDASKSSGNCLLRFLEVESLDLSNTKFHDLNEITELANLTRLNISNTPILSLEPLQDLPLLQTLIIGKDQFSQDKITAIPERITVQF